MSSAPPPDDETTPVEVPFGYDELARIDRAAWRRGLTREQFLERLVTEGLDARELPPSSGPRSRSGGNSPPSTA